MSNTQNIEKMESVKNLTTEFKVNETTNLKVVRMAEKTIHGGGVNVYKFYINNELKNEFTQLAGGYIGGFNAKNNKIVVALFKKSTNEIIGVKCLVDEKAVKKHFSNWMNKEDFEIITL